MKAIEIARKNHISTEDMMKVCTELEISCEGDDTDLLEKDIFLIEKKIEAIKKRKAHEIEESKKGKKIKLKRKVQMPKEGKEATAEETAKTASKKTEKPPAAATREHRGAPARPAIRRDASGRPIRREAGAGDRPKRPEFVRRSGI